MRLVERRTGLAERVAIWEAWLFELDGAVFVEPPPRRPPASFAYRIVMDYSTVVAAFDSRADVLSLLVEMRASGFDVRIEVERARL